MWIQILLPLHFSKACYSDQVAGALENPPVLPRQHEAEHGPARTHPWETTSAHPLLTGDLRASARMSGHTPVQRGGDRKPSFIYLTEVCCFLTFSEAYSSYFIMQAKWWLLITHWHIFNCINSSNDTILKWSSIQTPVGLALCIFRMTLKRQTQAPPPTLWFKYTGAVINTAVVF